MKKRKKKKKGEDRRAGEKLKKVIKTVRMPEMRDLSPEGCLAEKEPLAKLKVSE